MEYHKQERKKIQYIEKSLQQFQLYPSKKRSLELVQSVKQNQSLTHKKGFFVYPFIKTPLM